MHTRIDDLQREDFGNVGDPRDALTSEMALGPAVAVLEPRGQHAAMSCQPPYDPEKRSARALELVGLSAAK